MQETPVAETLVDLFETSALRFAERELFGTKTDEGWRWTTYAEVKSMADALRGGLVAAGIRRGDRVAIIAGNRLEWAVAAYACFGLGAAYVPMYESQHEREWAFILKDCGAKLLFVSTAYIFEKMETVVELVPSLERVVAIEDTPDTGYTYRAMLEQGAEHPESPARPSPEDVCCIIYTSGTTGEPKGVVLTHANIATNIAAVRDLGIIGETDRSLSFLPWAHCLGHTCELHGLVAMGASMGICERVENIVGNLAEVRPTVLFGVPRIFNKIYNGVQKQMAGKSAPIRWLFKNGLAAATKKNAGGKLGLGEALTRRLADALIFSKVRAKFGGRMKCAISGAAALSKEVAEFIDALGIVVYEGYGLTETSPIVSVNFPGNRRLGSVGKIIPGVRVLIDASADHEGDGGEILVYGPNVMLGYHDRPTETDAVFTFDGGFRTGDLGRVDEDGFLYITGRIKEQYKLENGKYVAPAPLEEQLKLSPLIANVMIHGANRPHNVALIVPDMDALKARLYGSQSVVPVHAPETLVSDGRVQELFAAEIAERSGGFKSYESVKRFALITEDFTQENGMLTPTLKLKRRNVLQKWGQEIERLYA